MSVSPDQAVPNSAKNVHQYDGQLKGLFHTTRQWTMDEKKELFESCREEYPDPVIHRTLSTIINDIPNDKQGSNYHLANDVDASDILAAILSHDEWREVKDILGEQLRDATSSGICDSGRVTRLFQVWQCLYDDHEHVPVVSNPNNEEKKGDLPVVAAKTVAVKTPQKAVPEQPPLARETSVDLRRYVEMSNHLNQLWANNPHRDWSAPQCFSSSVIDNGCCLRLIHCYADDFVAHVRNQLASAEIRYTVEKKSRVES